MTFKPVRIALLAAVMIVSLARCGSDSPTAPGIVSIALDLSSASIRIGSVIQINASVTVDGVAASQVVTFSSDNPSVLSVTSAGLLKALALGTANLTATTSSGATKTALITVVPGLPFSIAKSAGDNQSASGGAAVAVNPAVVVKDSAGNLLANVGVTFSVVSGGGSVTGGAATTNATGVATVGSWVLGTAGGTNTLSASVAGIAAVTFTATGTATAPASMQVSAGDGQTSVAGTAVAVLPAVIVRKADGTPAAGVAVTFAVSAGGGTVSGAAQTTGANGIATVGSWTLGASAGLNSLTASASGLPSVVFSATATLAPAPQILLSSNAAGFNTIVGGATPVAKTINISNSGTGTLSGLALGSITYGAGATGWLSATLSASTAPASVTLNAALGTLAAGTYTATLPVTAAGVSNSPQTITATFVVGPSTAASPHVVVQQQPVATVTGAVLATQPIVRVVDAGGSVVSTYNGHVQASIGSGNGVLSGTTNVTAVNGVATFTDLKITGSGTFTLLFSADLASSAGSTSFNVAALPASQLSVTTPPGGAATNANFTTQPVVELRDANNGLVINATAPVTVSLGAGTTGSGTLSGTLTVNAVSGVARFTDLKISAVGVYTLAFTSPGLPPITTATFSVTLAPPVAIAITTQPGGALTGSLLAPQPVVQLRDASASTVAGATNAVTATLSAGTGVLSGTTTVNAVNGVATFTDLKVVGSGTYTITFSAAGLTSATSGAVVIAPLPATQLNIATAPGGGTTGSVLTTQPVIQVRDASNGVVVGATNSVTATLNGAGGTLSGTTTVNAVNGMATFTDLKVTGSGTYTLTFSSSGLASATSGSITIAALPATRLIIATQPSGAVTGSVFGTQPVIQVQDATGSVVAGATNAVTAQLNGVGGTLSGTTTVNAVNGIATFPDLKITGSGSYTVTFTSGALTAATSGTIVITPLPATQLAIGTAPSGAATGQVLTTQPVIQVRDATNGPVNGATNVVVATLNGGGGTLSGTTSVAAVNGVATFTDLKVTGTGSYTLTFTSGALTPVTSGSITITALPATKLAIQTQPSGAVTGSVLATQPVIQIQDASSGIVAGATNAVTATLVGSGGTLSGTTTVNAVAGVATFTDLKVTGAGTYTVTFSSGALAPATSGNVVITPLPPTQLTIATAPSGAATGVALTTQPVINVRDVGNGVVNGATNAVTATLVGAGGTLSGTTTVSAVNGVATFTNLSVSGPGTYTITFSSGALTPVTSGSITITALPAAKLVVQAQPSGAVSGSVLGAQPVIQVQDASSGVVAGATNAVTAALVGAGGTLSGTTVVNAVNGVASFTDLKVTGAGTYTISFSSGALTSAASVSITITAQPPAALGIAAQPSGAVSGSVLAAQPVVQIRDASSGVVAGATNSVLATLNGAGGTLSGTTTIAAVNGVATFTNLTVTGAGTYSITFTSAGLTPATTGTFVITAQPATQLAVTTQPGGATSAVNFTTQPVVEVRNASNAVVAGATNAVTAALVGAGGTLSGTTTVNAVNGVATFTDLKVTGAGTYSLTFTSAGVTQATTSAFVVTAQPATQLAVTTQPAGATSAVNFTTQPVVEVRNASNTVVAGATNAITAALVGAGGTLSGTTTVNAVNGVAAFTDLKVTGAGTYTISFSAAGLTPATSNSLTVSAAPATKLAVVTQPLGAQTGVNLATQPVVQVQNAASGVVTGATDAVTAVLVGAGGTLSGTTTVNAVNGVATFTNLKVTGAGSYTLNFSSGTLTSATSGAFTITSPPPASIALNVGGAATTSAVNGTNLSIPITADMANAQGQNIASLTFNVTWDPAKFDFVSRTNGTFGTGPSFTVNQSNVASGTLAVSVFDTDGFSTGSPVILTVTLLPKAAASGTVVTVVPSAAGSDAGSDILSKIVVRPTAVTTP
ncbi:MAG: hypothetical protein JWM95_4754 [Gemmatimonadetes bacterium]|nr:hypothetical protein [Gemmatimonadota bacterium]